MSGQAEPQPEYVVFTRQAYEEAMDYMSRCMSHGSFITRRELGDPMPLVLFGAIDGIPTFTLGEPIPWQSLNE